MKTLLTATVLLIAGIASAQENNYNDLLKREKAPGIKKLQQFPRYDALHNYSAPQFFYIPPVPNDRLLATLENGSKIYALPQDNMPCLVPDMNQFNMPNAGSNVHIYHYPQQGAIPNPGIGIGTINTKRGSAPVIISTKRITTP